MTQKYKNQSERIGRSGANGNGGKPKSRLKAGAILMQNPVLAQKVLHKLWTGRGKTLYGFKGLKGLFRRLTRACRLNLEQFTKDKNDAAGRTRDVPKSRETTSDCVPTIEVLVIA